MPYHNSGSSLWAILVKNEICGRHWFSVVRYWKSMLALSGGNVYYDKVMPPTIVVSRNDFDKKMKSNEMSY